MKSLALAAPLAAALAAAIMPGASLAESSLETIGKVKVDAGAAFFDAECHRCHSPNADKASYGPSLEDIVGRPAGKAPGYGYSEALANAGFVWTPSALRAWMEDNDGFLPGTKMRHVGIEDRTVQDFILAYLTSISSN